MRFLKALTNSFALSFEDCGDIPGARPGKRAEAPLGYALGRDACVMFPRLF
jgi:hypothetical protein